jgi:hypothetical protein
MEAADFYEIVLYQRDHCLSLIHYSRSDLAFHVEAHCS